MMHALFLRLAGPMQSWGVQSRFSIRDTAREPTKSGVLGIVCAALGRERDSSLDDLRALRLAIRVDREGHPRRDFHTAQNVLIASNTARQIDRGVAKLKETEPSHRHYLADAWFTAALIGKDRALLEAIDDALGSPKWPLFFGRKAFVPALPIRIDNSNGKPLGVQQFNALDLLLEFEDPIGMRVTNRNGPRRFVIDADIPHSLQIVQERMQPDDPVSFLSRSYLPRRVFVGYEYVDAPA